jgi:hypothetical protein
LLSSAAAASVVAATAVALADALPLIGDGGRGHHRLLVHAADRTRGMGKPASPRAKQVASPSLAAHTAAHARVEGEEGRRETEKEKRGNRVYANVAP